MTNPFTLIPATARRYCYLAYGLATLLIACTAAYCGALDLPVPDVAVGIGGALVPIGAALAGMAASNTADTTAQLDDASPSGESAGAASQLPEGEPVRTVPLADPAADYDDPPAPYTGPATPDHD